MFEGWRVVGGVFGLMAIACGLGFYNASVYLEVMVADRGISVVAASGASATFFVTFGLAGVPISRWLTGRDPRPVIVAGGLVGGVALFALTSARAAPQLYVAFAVFGLAFAAVSFVPGTTLVTRWFTRQRALALTIATTGLSVGGIVITPLSASAIERSGLDAVGPWLALGWTGGILLVTSVAIRPSPQAVGLAPDGDPRPHGGAAPETGIRPGVAYRTRTFRLLTVAVLVLIPVVIVESFRGSHYPSIYAMIQLVSTLGIAAGPILFGAVRQASGGYAAGALAAAAVSLLAAAVLLAALRARTRDPVVA